MHDGKKGRTRRDHPKKGQKKTPTPPLVWGSLVGKTQPKPNRNNGWVGWGFFFWTTTEREGIKAKAMESLDGHTQAKRCFSASILQEKAGGKRKPELKKKTGEGKRKREKSKTPKEIRKNAWFPGAGGENQTKKKKKTRGEDPSLDQKGPSIKQVQFGGEQWCRYSRSKGADIKGEGVGRTSKPDFLIPAIKTY